MMMMMNISIDNYNNNLRSGRRPTRRAREEAVPRRRIGSPVDIANAVVWLASPRSDYVTGQQILVDDGVDQNLFSVVRASGGAPSPTD